MAAKAEQQKIELIERAVDVAKSRLAADRASELIGFIRLFYANVAPDDLLRDTPVNLYSAALSLWTFGAHRPANTAKVRVFNPRLEEQGWRSRHTVVEMVNDDMPFLVDSLTAALNQRELTVHLVIHPIIRIGRDGAGNRVAKGAAGIAESFMQIRINEQSSNERLAEIRTGLEQVLADVRAAVDDWRQMRARNEELIKEFDKAPKSLPGEDVAEARAFLRWLNDDHYTFLGYRAYDFADKGGTASLSIVPGSGLGLLRDDNFSVFDGLRYFEKLPPEVREFLRAPRALMITKANRRSTVHRPVHLDTIVIKKFDKAGKVVGERLFVGLLTSAGYSQSPREIPFLRRKVADCFERAGFDPASHDGKALAHILESYPRDELLQVSTDELYDIARGILHLQERQRTALFTRRDPFGRFVSCLVYIPRDRFTTELRLRIQNILAEAYDGQVGAYYTHMTDAALGRLHVIITLKPGATPDVDANLVERRLVEASRSWTDQLQEALVESLGEERGLASLRRYADAFPAGYRERFSPNIAVLDIEKTDEALGRGGLAINLYRPAEVAGHDVRLKLYNAGVQLPLSDVLPMLEHMGFKVLSEAPYMVEPRASGRVVWIHDFSMVTTDGSEIDLGAVRHYFHVALDRVWSGDLEDDSFNCLVLRAGLDWREVGILRAYCRYLRQAAIPFGQAYMEAALTRYPSIALLLVRLFRIQFKPGVADAARADAIVAEIKAALENVANLDDDRILRRFLNAIQATLRTNFFQPGHGRKYKSYLSFKLDSRQIDELPLPRPLYEIFVYSPRVEAIHLRGGKVARGGIRWSDRREDFRTEILGLMKTQMVKNSVIVPVGSKGGFIVKRPPAGGSRDALMAEVVESYKTLMRGLLDLTDNLVGGKVVPPADVVRRDDDDPYLVVAADKGTATFSDIANGVSAEYGFWLGDAFASGGSAGYDHRKMGITARGAWECVKRHFREKDVDILSTDFTVVGVGDMSGDVFGNGMLLSPHIRLVAAFNHMHIFLDPDPDAAASLKERQRLFDLPRSSWADYDAKLISPGGGVHDRKVKSIKLTDQVKKRFGLAQDSMTPAELIQHLLKAEVDLLWLGGIGTYVKSSDESHADVGDRANDGVRVDAAALRCKVVGEGANLGFTQRGRIEYAFRGGAINTDAVDNSAGVDTSDHEVNIKILLNEIVAAGDMTVKQRDKLLATLTDEVGQLVLRDNYLQSQTITVIQHLGGRMLDRQVRFMRQLERAGRLDRAIEHLPDEEATAERKAHGIGLARPEFAVLLAYAKLVLYDELLSTDLPDDPQLIGDLLEYFPKPLRKNYRQQIANHRLRREIIATVATNEMINRVGFNFVQEVRELTGMGPADIARAYIAAREVFDLRRVWRDVEALDNKVPAKLQAAILVESGRALERGTVWLLRNAAHPLEIASCIATYGEGIKELARAEGIVVGADRARIDARRDDYVKQGVPAELAGRAAVLNLLAPSLDIIRLAKQAGASVEAIGRVYFAVGERFALDWLRTAALAIPVESHWDKQAIAAIVEDFYGHQSHLTGRVIQDGLGARGGPKGEGAAGAIAAWTNNRAVATQRTDTLIADLRQSGNTGLAMLAVANRQLRSLIGD